MELSIGVFWVFGVVWLGWFVIFGFCVCDFGVVGLIGLFVLICLLFTMVDRLV